MSSGKEDDNFDNLVNSLKPIKYKYSNQSLKLDKLFKKLNIESIEKKLHSKGKPPATFKDSLLYKNVDNTYNISGDCYDYFEDINGLKKMPIKIDKKGTDFVKHLYNPEFERRIDEFIYYKKEEEETKLNPKEEFKFYKGFKQPSFGLDPGYYHPNYNYVKKRIPAFDFSKSKKFYTNNEPIKNMDKKKRGEQDHNNDKKEDFKEEINKSDLLDKKETFDNYIFKNANINNQFLKQNLNNIKNKTILKIQSRNQKNLNKNISSTQNNILPKINIKEDKSIGKKILAKKINQKEHFKKILSTPNIISFKKMSGRDHENRKLTSNTSDIFYRPNYNCNSPHVPSYLFNASDIKKDYKKYRVGKILRSYIFDPYKYFVMDIKENNNINNSKDNIINKHLNQNKKNKNKRYKSN